MLPEDDAAEILDNSDATLMGQRISADVAAVGREDSQTDRVAAKQRLAGQDDGGLGVLEI